MKLRTFLQNHATIFKIYKWACNLFANTKWQRAQAVRNGGVYYELLEEDHNRLRELLKKDYYVILTHRKCHFTTYLIALTSYFATGKMSYWTHAFMNVEGDISNNMDYKIIEATGEGVHWSTFLEVFDCDGVVLLKPRGIPKEQWNLVMENVKADIGLEYDLFFDIADASKVSCVELIYQAIKLVPEYEKRFPELIKLIESQKGELTPQDLYDCNDMDLVFEVKR